MQKKWAGWRDRPWLEGVEDGREIFFLQLPTQAFVDKVSIPYPLPLNDGVPTGVNLRERKPASSRA